jgi:hypothetical protein
MLNRRALSKLAAAFAVGGPLYAVRSVSGFSPAHIDGRGNDRGTKEIAMSTHLTVVPSTTSQDAPNIAPPRSPDAAGDYELTIFLDFDFQDYSDRRPGAWWPATYGRYVVAAGRKDGAWRMNVRQVLADDEKHGDHIYGPDLMDVDDQIEGPDALALLQTLLGGQAVLDGTQVIQGLSQRELAALAAASPELKAELIALMSRDYAYDAFARWFGRWALTASAEDIDGFYHTDPRYMELAARVRDENLAGKAFAAYRARKLAALGVRPEALADAEPALANFAAD